MGLQGFAISMKVFEPTPLSQGSTVELHSTGSSDARSITNVSRSIIQELGHIRQQTASYIAGFICRKVLNEQCNECRAALLSETNVDSHAYTILKDLGNKFMYPSNNFITEILYKKKIIFENIPKYVHHNLLNMNVTINLDFLRCKVHLLDITSATFSP